MFFFSQCLTDFSLEEPEFAIDNILPILQTVPE